MTAAFDFKRRQSSVVTTPQMFLLFVLFQFSYLFCDPVTCFLYIYLHWIVLACQLTVYWSLPSYQSFINLVLMQDDTSSQRCCLTDLHWNVLYINCFKNVIRLQSFKSYTKPKYVTFVSYMTVEGDWTSWGDGAMCMTSKYASNQWGACQRFIPGRLTDSLAFLPGNMEALELELLLHPVCKGCLLALHSALYSATQPGNLST